MKVQSKTYPKITKSRKEKIVRVPYNIEKVIREEKIFYQYNESILPDDEYTMDEQILLMRKIEWPEARIDIDYVIDESQSELQALEEWISAGAMLRDEEGQYTGKAEKVEWKGTYPEPDPLLVKIEELEARIVELEKQ